MPNTIKCRYSADKGGYVATEEVKAGDTLVFEIPGHTEFQDGPSPALQRKEFDSNERGAAMTTLEDLQEFDAILAGLKNDDQLVTLTLAEPIMTANWTYYSISLHALCQRLHALVKEEIERKRQQPKIEELRIASGTKEQAKLEVAAADELIRRALFKGIPPDPSLPLRP